MSQLPLLAQLTQVFAALSLMSIGGVNALLPEIQRQVVEVQQWMDNAAFADIFAISHAAPGPNIIMVSLIGWHVSGLAGLVVATLAITLPSCLLAFGVGRAAARWAGRRWFMRLKAALVPIALGLVAASGVAMMEITARDAATLAMGAGTALFVLLSRRNPLWALGACVAVSVALVQMSGEA